MKKKPKKVRKILCCIGVAIVALFLGGCVSTFFDTLHAEKGDIFSRIGQIVLVLSAFSFLWWIYSVTEDLKWFKDKEKSNFVFRFSRRLSPSWTTEDSVLAELVYDYGLRDEEIERIVKDGVYNAVMEYYKSHPLDCYPPRYDIC